MSKNKGIRPKNYYLNLVFDYICAVKKLELLFVFIGSFVFAQDHLSGFNLMSFTYKATPKWMAYVELQTRSRRDYSVIDY